MTLLFALTLFVSAFLLFWVQPLAGKMLLPLLGGTPAVWNTCMLFFQAMLLAGYAYVLALTRWLSTRAQIITHAALLLVAALSFPVSINETNAAGLSVGASPVVWLLKTLLLTVGPPFFVLSASAPLLQKWFSRTRARTASDPYFLYAASNAGSLFALLAFPVLLEPMLALQQQSRAWAFTYAALAALIAACAAFLWRALPTDSDATEKTVGAELVPARDDSFDSTLSSSDAERAEDLRPAPTEHVATELSSERLTIRRRLRWALLAFVPSSLVLGVTTYITTDVAAVPLLWVIPLSLYLLSFVLVFARRQFAPRRLAARLLPGAAILLTLVYLSGATQPAWFLILFHLIFLFVAALVCHGQLADDCPPTQDLAEFYLWLAVGGVAGGVFNALLAPLLFNSVVEYPLVILLASYLRPAFRRARGQLLGLHLGAKKVERRAGKIEDESGVENRVEDESNAVENEHGDENESDGVSERGDVADEKESGDVADESRVNWLDLLLPVSLGALAAVLALVAPHIGASTDEHVAVERIAVSLGLPLFLLNHFFSPRPLRFALGLAAVMLASVVFSQSSGETLHASRNFFGTLRVAEGNTAEGEEHWLHHGSTLHGKQSTDAARACRPLSYYHREGPLGSVFAAFDLKPDADARHVAVVGLGAGTTAAYARAGETWTFYEIDPAVVSIARDPKLFTYLTKCAAAPVEVVLGDARLRLRDAAPDAYDLIVLDAFSSDAVPAHLLTREALALYLSKLAARGLIVFHVSNRSLDLERVVGGDARDAGLVARIFADGEYKPEIGKDPSTWVVVARSPQDLGALSLDTRWQTLDERTYKLELWRDDFSNVISVFK